MSIKIHDLGKLKKTAAGPTFESQLATLSLRQVEEKLPILSQYVVGFQLFDKNEDNTEGKGVSIYLVGMQPLYIPSFYAKNSCKATEVMVLPEHNLCLPANEDMVAYVVELASRPVGRELAGGELGSTFHRAAGNISLDRLINPLSKKASADLLQEFSDAIQKCDVASPAVTDIALALGKTASARLINVLATEPQVLNAMLDQYGQEGLSKFASRAEELYGKPVEAPKAVCVEPFTKAAALLTEAEHNTLARQGYLIKSPFPDNAEVMDALTYQPNELTSATTFGAYKLLTVEGTLVDAIVVPSKEEGMSRTLVVLTGEPDGAMQMYPESPIGIRQPKDDTAVFEELKKFLDIAEEGSFPTEHGIYHVVYKGLAYPVGYHQLEIIDGAHAVADIKEIGNSRDGCPHGHIIAPAGSLLVYERKLRTYDSDRQLFATKDTLEGVLERYMKKNFTTVTVKVDGQTVDLETSDTAGRAEAMPTKTAALHLANRYKIDPVDISIMLTDDGTGKDKRYFITKTAAYGDYSWGSSPSDDPMLAFHQVSETDPNIETVDVNSVSMVGNRDQIIKRINDAAAKGIKEVLDVSVVRAILNSNDPVNIEGEFLGAMMGTLDKLCRRLMLIYAYPDVYERRYGDANMTELINVIKSAMDDISDMIIFLRNRSVLTPGIMGGRNELSAGAAY